MAHSDPGRPAMVYESGLALSSIWETERQITGAEPLLQSVKTAICAPTAPLVKPARVTVMFGGVLLAEPVLRRMAAKRTSSKTPPTKIRRFRDISPYGYNPGIREG